MSFQSVRPTGPVVSILDGDTIEVLNGHHAERIRLSGIDCPDMGQAFGKRTKQAASALAFGKEVTLRTHGYDKYKRTLPMCCYRMEPTAITRWSKTVGAGGIGSMRQEIGAGRVGEGSGEAREARKGLWAESLPVPPWEWRTIKR